MSAAADGSIFFDNGMTAMSYHGFSSTRSRILFINFAPFGATGVDERFHGKFALDAGCDVISVRKREENWYQDLSIAEFRDAVRPIAVNYEDVICYGISMGGYASLYFSGTVNAACLAISPMVSVHPAYKMFGLRRYREKVLFRHTSLIEVPKSTGKKTVIIYDPDEPNDKIYLEHEVFPAFLAADRLPLKFSGHPSASLLYEIRQLQALVLAFTLRKSIPTAADLMRGRKNMSKTYLANFASTCAKRGKIRTALSLYKRATAIDPSLIDADIFQSAMFDLAKSEARAAQQARCHAGSPGNI